MPNRKGHEAITKAAIGKPYSRIHTVKDEASQWMGSKHRSVAHDPESNAFLAIALYPKDPLGAFIAAELHDATDALVSDIPNPARKLVVAALDSFAKRSRRG